MEVQFDGPEEFCFDESFKKERQKITCIGVIRWVVERGGLFSAVGQYGLKENRIQCI